MIMNDYGKQCEDSSKCRLKVLYLLKSPLRIDIQRKKANIVVRYLWSPVHVGMVHRLRLIHTYQSKVHVNILTEIRN